jgi:hypothetical protein
MRYTAKVSFNVFIEADSPEEAHELILDDFEYAYGDVVSG